MVVIIRVNPNLSLRKARIISLIPRTLPNKEINSLNFKSFGKRRTKTGEMTKAWKTMVWHERLLTCGDLSSPNFAHLSAFSRKTFCFIWGVEPQPTQLLPPTSMAKAVFAGPSTHDFVFFLAPFPIKNLKSLHLFTSFSIPMFNTHEFSEMTP